jgi:hypothetical protein
MEIKEVIFFGDFLILIGLVRKVIFFGDRISLKIHTYHWPSQKSKY